MSKQQKTDYTKVNILEMENQRLNNVLNELEKWLKEDDEISKISFEMGKHFNYKDVINKIYELKESDK